MRADHVDLNESRVFPSLKRVQGFLEDKAIAKYETDGKLKPEDEQDAETNNTDDESVSEQDVDPVGPSDPIPLPNVISKPATVNVVTVSGTKMSVTVTTTSETLVRPTGLVPMGPPPPLVPINDQHPFPSAPTPNTGGNTSPIQIPSLPQVSDTLPGGSKIRTIFNGLGGADSCAKKGKTQHCTKNRSRIANIS